MQGRRNKRSDEGEWLETHLLNVQVCNKAQSFIAHIGVASSSYSSVYEGQARTSAYLNDVGRAYCEARKHAHTHEHIPILVNNISNLLPPLIQTTPSMRKEYYNLLATLIIRSLLYKVICTYFLCLVSVPDPNAHLRISKQCLSEISFQRSL